MDEIFRNVAIEDHLADESQVRYGEAHLRAVRRDARRARGGQARWCCKQDYGPKLLEEMWQARNIPAGSKRMGKVPEDMLARRGRFLPYHRCLTSFRRSRSSKRGNKVSETDKILHDIRTYLRIAASAAAKSMAGAVLDTQEKALVYSKMDGKTSQQKISSSSGVPQKTISNWADEFVEAKLAMPPDEYYPSHRALFSLAELGISLQALRKRAKGTKSQPSSQTLGASVVQEKKEVTRNT